MFFSSFPMVACKIKWSEAVCLIWNFLRRDTEFCKDRHKDGSTTQWPNIFSTICKNININLNKIFHFGPLSQDTKCSSSFFFNVKNWILLYKILFYQSRCDMSSHFSVLHRKSFFSGPFFAPQVKWSKKLNHRCTRTGKEETRAIFIHFKR